MPQFCAFDFLSEAQRKNQVFLSYFLVAVPFHLETVDQYAHNGSVGNDSFRKPWLYEDGGMFVDDLEDNGLTSKEAASKDIIHNERPYEESSSTQWTVERFSIEDDITVIPSSNPESPEITNEERFQLQSSFLSSMNDSDTLSDDDNILALQACSWTRSQSEDEDLLLEVPEACFNSFAEPVPHIKELCLHLKKKQVKDPFLDSSGNKVCQSHIFRRDFTFLIGCETKSKSFEGSTKKNVLTEDILTENDFVPEKAEDDLYLELPVGTLTGKTAPPARECVSPLVESDSLQETADTHLQKDFSVLKEFNGAACTSTGSEKYFLKKVNFEEDFPQIEVKSTRDEFALTNMHEVPAIITMGNSPPPPFPSPFDKPSDVELCDIDWEESRQIVSPDTMLKIGSQQWRDEKYFGAVSSLLVKEPTIAETVESKPSLSLHQELKEQLHLTSETGLEPSTREVLSDDLANLVTHRLQSLNQSFPKVETFLQEKTESKDWAQELDMKALPISLNENDVSYTKVSISALCGQGVSKQRSLSKSAMEATVPRTMSVSSKIASVVRTSKQELEQKETIDVATMDKKVEENVIKDCQRQKSFEKTDSKCQPASNKPSLQDQQLMTDGGPITASSVNSLKVKREIKQPSKRKSFLDDQLNDFLFLTGVTSGYEKSFKRVKNKWKNDKDGDEVKDQEQITIKHDVANKTDTAPHKEEAKPPVAKEEEIIQEDEPQVKKKKKNKSKTVIIKIPDYYQKVLDVVEETGGPIVHHLQREGYISESVSFKLLTADDIRAQIKQVYEDAGIKTKKDCSNAKLKSLAQLYVCLATFEVAIYCSLTSAIVGLSAMLQKYHFIIGDSLDGLRQDLSKIQCSLDESCLPHPKMVEMARQISHWFKKKVEKAGEDQDLKILVILKRESARLSESIVMTLNSIKGLRAVSLEASTPASPMITSKALDSHNCLVVTASQLHQDFLWAQFSLVVEYEFQESPSVWQTICVRQNIRHMGLCIERKSAGESVVKDETKVCRAEGSSGQYCLKLLCSTKVTENSKLIHYLESRYNIMVLERNYNKIVPSFRPSLVYADIIVDVVTGIVLLSSEEVLSLGVEGLTHKVNSLSQQFEVLWLLINIDNENKSILHNKAFRKITCQLYSAFAQYSKTGSQYEVKMLFGCTIQELGDAIHMICKKSEENISSAWHKEDWIKRLCLTAQASKHEVFLMQFPSINAFTAQVLLTSAPLCKLLANYSADDLVTMAPWIPIKFLKIFEDYLKKGHSMGMTGPLSKTDCVSKESLLDQSGFDHTVATSLPRQYGQARMLQHDGQAKPPHSDRSHHVKEWNIKEEPSDTLRSDFKFNDETVSKDSISSSRYSFQQPMTRHYDQRSAPDLFAVKEEKPDCDSSVTNMEMTDRYETINYDQPLQCSTGTADSLMTAMPTGNLAMRGQCHPELTAVNTLPYNTSSRLYNSGAVHPSRTVTSHNPNDLSHHQYQRVHPNQMAESYQRSAVLNTNSRQPLHNVSKFWNNFSSRRINFEEFKFTIFAIV